MPVLNRCWSISAGKNKGDIFNNQQWLEAAMEGSRGDGVDGGQ